jgi:hypothetical protein
VSSSLHGALPASVDPIDRVAGVFFRLRDREHDF